MYLTCCDSIALLKTDEALITILFIYTDFADVFSPDLIVELPEHTKINNCAIVLRDSKQPPYGLIYNLGLIELEIVKTYIVTNLAYNFINSFKSPADIPVLFDLKLNSSFYLYVN